MNLINKIIERAKADKQRIVLPEGTEKRTLEAANQLIGDGVAEIILLGNQKEINALADEMKLQNIGKATIIDPKNHDKKQIYTDLLVELRKSKGMTPEKAAVIVEDPLYLACLMIKNGDADGEIAGAQNTTGDVLRPALQIIKTSPGVSVVSGAFIMFTQTPQYGENGTLFCRLCSNAQPQCTRTCLHSHSFGANGTRISWCGTARGNVEFFYQRQCATRND